MDGRNRFGINNRNSIGIEICINDNIAKATENSAYLAAHLLQRHNIPIERMVRHYDASRKRCPNTMSANNWAKWHEFIAKVKSILNGTNKPKEDELDMKKEDVIALIDSKIQANNTALKKEIEDSILRPDPGQDWVEPDFKELNDFLKENGVDEFTETNHSLLTNRAVVVRMLNLVRKATAKEIMGMIRDL